MRTSEPDDAPWPSDLSGLVDEKIRPVLAALSADDTDVASGKALSRLKGATTFAFFGFAIGFTVFAIFVPDTWWGTALKFILFPVGFLGSLFLAAWLNRDALSVFIFGTQKRFVAKSKAMTALAEAVGLTYVASPGGAPESLKIMKRLGFLQGEIQSVLETLERHGGLEADVAAAVEAGLLQSDIVVLGSPEQKARYYRQSALGQSFEDGFLGHRGGVAFSAFEWIERVDDADDRYHLILVFRSPYRLSGSTQLRSRKTSWPGRIDQAFQDVHLVPEEFAKTFRLRSTDQVEARTLFNPAVIERVLTLAHGDPFRAVAAGNHLVIDVVGRNRFSLIDLTSGEWSEAGIHQTIVDLSDVLRVVDVMATTFMLDR